ncbi:MAG: FAD-dependent monooxygenase, partial [Pseudomonadota bacterium]|nr:FAD-dependent monooxygenase [Pseudomonadota bacterium]
EEYDYQQTLFVARLRTEQAPDGAAYERLTRDGPTALLPRGDRHFGLVHAVPSAEADAVAALDEAAFLARAQEVFGWRAGRFLSCGERSRYPALRLVAARTVAPRALLVGNAAQSLHPIGAQGFNLGLRDALTLAELVEGGRLHHRPGQPPADDFDCGAPRLLDEYVRRRRQDREETVAFSDGLARLSANDGALARTVRVAGLLAAARLPAVQSQLVGGALGYRGEVPALCRPGA